MDTQILLTTVLQGAAVGGIYAAVALAVVMIYQATDHFNFAQGEMAMFSAYIAYMLLGLGLPYWVAFVATVAISFIGGAVLERVIVRPVESAPVLNQIIVFIGLLIIINSLAGFFWDFTIKEFPTPFGDSSLYGLISAHQAGVIGVVIVMVLLVFAFFRFTNVGLAMRAAAQNPDSARLVGVDVGRMLMLGWALAAAIGAVAGMLVAHLVFLEPNMMVGVLLYGFAGALLGGVSSPGGAVIGGFLVGILENLIAIYMEDGNALKSSVALVVIVAILVFRPDGLFGRTSVKRV